MNHLGVLGLNLGIVGQVMVHRRLQMVGAHGCNGQCCMLVGINFPLLSTFNLKNNIWVKTQLVQLAHAVD
jgi:hypothetical protein